MENEQTRVDKNIPLHVNNATNMIFRPVIWDHDVLLKKYITEYNTYIYTLLRIGDDKTVMICNTRLPHITSGLCLYIKRVKKEP